MKFVSTRGETAPVRLEEALRAGLAPDGGLFMPERIPALATAASEPPLPPTPADTAARVLAPYVEELEPRELLELAADALDFDLPLVEVADGVYVLELFHGPTLAFKDVGARFLARLLTSLGGRPGGLRSDRASRPLTVLVATSGDTGGAVAQAFFGLAGTRVIVLYPRGRVSPLQEKQFTTLGGNVLALEVAGDFDDCQRLVKEAFADRELRREFDLTSANSINIGRLLPQMVYYFHAASRLPSGSRPLFSVPSGNFGNLTAGLMALEMGLPAAGFIAATNVNDSVPRYLESGRYEPRASRRTLSTAMDVGAPSNFARMLHLFAGDLDAMREVVRGSRHDDRSTREVIRSVRRETGYLLDPHTAVGYLALRERQRRGGGPGVVLATAHPAKFRETVEEIADEPVEVPRRLARGLELPSLALEIAPRLSELAAALGR